MQLRRRGGLPAYRVVVVPFRIAGGLKNSALVLIDDAEKTRVGFLQHIREIYGFTQAEGALAIGLISGIAPEEYAETRGVRITTVRTQIRSMMDKAGVTRLIELVAALVQVPSATA